MQKVTRACYEDGHDRIQKSFQSVKQNANRIYKIETQSSC